MAFVDIQALADVQLDAIADVDAIDNRKYLKPLIDLLPPGIAWTREWQALLTDVLRACAAEFSRVARGARQIRKYEIDPRTTSWLIDEWEDFLGLPICSPGPEDLASRRAAAYAKLIGRGFAVLAFITEVALALGYVITVYEYYNSVMHADSPCDHKLFGEEWKHVWKITTPSGANDELLVCTLTFYNPSHTILIIEFT